MNFCPNCGVKIEIENSKSCPNCGSSLQVINEKSEESKISEKSMDMKPEKITNAVADNEEIESEFTAKNAYHLGFKFEDMVEQILKAKGYSTERRIKIKGATDNPEFDIIAKKKRKGKEIIIAVECKNYSNTISPDLVRTFIFKLDDTGIPNGLFVAIPDFSSGAKSLGESRGLQLWDEDAVKEEFFQLQIGRLSVGDKVDFKFHLPIKTDYNYATNLEFQNKGKVDISSVELVWRPFYRVFYELNSVQTDPIKRKHRITDSGFFIVDALLKSTPPQKDGTSNIVKSISFGLLGKTAEEKKEEKEVGVLKKELKQNPERDFSITQPDNYKIIKLSPQISEVAARGETIDYVVDKNTKTIECEIPTRKKKRKDDFDFDIPDIRICTLKPSRKDVIINEIQLIHVPKWEVEFESGDYTYTRLISANSGTIIADNISHCNKHILKDLIKKKNVAVCDVCGKALCKDHIFKCPVCGSWFCEDHSIQCSGCKTGFCVEHIKNKCVECGEAICSTCSLRCPICGETHCNKHITKCDKCGNAVCISCTRKEGNLIFKKTMCKKCQ